MLRITALVCIYAMYFVVFKAFCSIVTKTMRVVFKQFAKYLRQVKIPQIGFCIIKKFRSGVGLRRFMTLPEHGMGTKSNNLTVDRRTGNCQACCKSTVFNHGKLRGIV